MTLMKRSSSMLPGFFFDDFFGRNWELENSTMPAVNISEDNDAYHVKLAAPGMNKKDFNVSLNDQRLTISYEKEEKTEEDKEGKFTKREFNYSSFQRSFLLPQLVDQAKIKEEYKDGILHLNIPKMEEAKKKPSRLIDIS